MNSIKTLALATLLATSATAVQAGERDHLAYRMLAEAGQIIAAQGNIALREIRADLQEDLSQTVQQWLPQSAAPAPAAAAQPAALNDYVQMHQEALAQ